MMINNEKSESGLIQPDYRFLFAHPAHFIALGFGAGLAPKAPGTVGTLLALPLCYAMLALPQTGYWLVILLMFLLGVVVCHKAGEGLGQTDHGSIVWDEIVAMLLVLAFAPQNLLGWLLAFVLFRFFDIYKPFPIAQLDARVKGGLGVMLDDLMAAVYAVAVMKVGSWLMMHF